MASLDAQLLKDLEDLSDEEEEIQVVASEQPKLIVQSKLFDDQELLDLLESLKEEKELNYEQAQISKFSRSHPLFEMIKSVNHYLGEIESEVAILHKSLKDVYLAKLPELESIIYEPVLYAKVVTQIGNSTNISEVNFDGILNNQTLMNLTVASSVTTPKLLNEGDLATALDLASQLMRLSDSKITLLTGLQKRMRLVCPNLAELLGITVASKLVAAAGGVKELAIMPPGNIQVLGKQKKALQGMSVSTLGIHFGHLTEVEAVKQAPESYKKQIIRMFSSKTALAARVDNSHSNPDGEQGKKLLDQIVSRFDKVIAPQEAPLKRPLPKPDRKERVGRGGRKFKNKKEQLQMTEYRKMMNTTKFGPEAEEEYRDTGVGLGLLAMQGSTKLRAAANKKQKEREKKRQEQKNKILTGEAKKTDGMESSMVFASQRGIDLINPEQLKKEYQDMKGYFSTTSGFSTVLAQKKK